VHCPKGIAAPTQTELIAWVAERLAGFKVPVKVWFKDDPLERNAAGKILKRELKTELFD
jgi:long-chain acyl-CoA synthetase